MFLYPTKEKHYIFFLNEEGFGGRARTVVSCYSSLTLNKHANIILIFPQFQRSHHVCPDGDHSSQLPCLVNYSHYTWTTCHSMKYVTVSITSFTKKILMSPLSSCWLSIAVLCFYHGLFPERQSHGHGTSCFMRGNLNSGRLRENRREQTCLQTLQL